MNLLLNKLTDIKCRSNTGKIYFTHSDLQQLPEWPEGPLIEIIQGDLYLVPSPTIKHKRISAELEFQIRKFLKQHDLGELFDAPVDVILAEDEVVIPDMHFVSNERKSIVKEKNVQGAPDFIIEILSSNKERDLIYKKALYEKYRVREYWVIDPEDKVVEVFLLEEQTASENYLFNRRKRYRKNDLVPVISIPGLKIDLARVFE